MNSLLSRLCTLLFLALIVPAAGAGDLEEGIRHLQAGDYKAAALLFERSAEAGDATAQFNFGLMLSRGLGVSQDESKAVYWYQKAAQQGNLGAQNNLGLMYTLGRGVARDDVQADAWYLIAAAGGAQGARENSKMLQDRMSATQIQQAAQRYNEWLKDHPRTAPVRSM